jgi:hypothetical protein
MKTVWNRFQSMDNVRKLFLLAGFVFLYGALASADLFIGVAGVYFIAKSWFNWGCYGGVCKAPETKMDEN